MAHSVSMLSAYMRTQKLTRSVREGLAVVAADAQHRATVVTAQTVAMKQNATQSVALDNVHSLLTEVTDVGRRRFPEDQRLGILHASCIPYTEWSRKKIAQRLMHRHFAIVCSRIMRFSPKCAEINW